MVNPTEVRAKVRGWTPREREKAAAVYWVGGVPIGIASDLMGVLPDRTRFFERPARVIWEQIEEACPEAGAILSFVARKRGANYNEICRHTDLGLRELHSVMRPLVTNLTNILRPPENWDPKKWGRWEMGFPLLFSMQSTFPDEGTPPGKRPEPSEVEDEKLEEFPEVTDKADRLGTVWPFCSVYFIPGESLEHAARAVSRVGLRRVFKRWTPRVADRGRLTKGFWFEDLTWLALAPLREKYRFRMLRRPRIGRGDIDVLIPRLMTVIFSTYHIFPNKTMPSHAIDMTRRVNVLPSVGFKRCELVLVVGNYFSPGFDDQLATSLEMRPLARGAKFDVFEFGVWREEDLEDRLEDLTAWLDARIGPQARRYPYYRVEVLEAELAEIRARLRTGPPWGPDVVERAALLRRIPELEGEIRRRMER